MRPARVPARRIIVSSTYSTEKKEPSRAIVLRKALRYEEIANGQDDS